MSHERDLEFRPGGPAGSSPDREVGVQCGNTSLEGPEGRHDPDSKFATVDPARLHFSAEVPEGEVAAWTEIEAGRFMPRRVRGSFQGRALG
jgi:hypothetical protein